jgi:signal transduction histidine kinase
MLCRQNSSGGEQSALPSRRRPGSASFASVTLKNQLLAVLVVPAVLVIVATAFFADVAARRALESSLGDRLTSIAEAATTLVDPTVLLLQKGEDNLRTKKNALAKLTKLAAATGVERIVIVRFQDGAALIDTSEELNVGDEYTRAIFDRTELESVQKGKGIASILFSGPDGRRYKTGYGPLYDEEQKVAGFAAVDGRASFFEAIDELRRTMGAVAILACLLLVAAALISAKRVSVPLSKLSEAAQRIGEGHLDTEIPSGGPEEAIVLEKTMRSMSRSLRVREEELQMMLAGIAHEVRNPLGGIELFGGLLREDLDEKDPRRKHVDKILKELATLARVVNDFLDFARRAEPQLRPTELHDLLEEVAQISARDASTSEVEVSLSAERGVAANVDPDQMKRAVLNLVRNGIQAAPKGGRVKIRLEKNGTATRIVISDNGPGIPKDKRQEIFAPFFTTKQKGTGLGLALVKKTVDAHRGTILVGEAEGGGAELTIELPS